MKEPYVLSVSSNAATLYFGIYAINRKIKGEPLIDDEFLSDAEKSAYALADKAADRILRIPVLMRVIKKYKK